MLAIDTELSALVAEPEKPESTSEPACQNLAEMSAFFDRSLARASLSRLVHLPSDGPLFERVGYDTARLVIPKKEYHAVLALLDGSSEGHYKDGELICGWYVTLADGSIAAFAIVGAPRNNGGPYVDAFLIIPEGVHVTAPNPSLPPTRDLAQQFTFPYPDGTYKVIQLAASVA